MNKFKEELFHEMLDFMEDLPCGLEPIMIRMGLDSETFYELLEDEDN